MPAASGAARELPPSPSGCKGTVLRRRRLLLIQELGKAHLFFGELPPYAFILRLPLFC